MEHIMKFAGRWASVLLDLLISIGIAVVVVFILSRIIRTIIRKRSRGTVPINYRYLEHVTRIVIIIIAVFWVISNNDATNSLGRMLFQGTAIIGAVAGFAAQPVISDLFCGLMLSTLKPFELGDRIVLEDGTAGIVKDITIRHVVLRLIDSTDMIIPNSKLNAMEITNMSHCPTRRSFELELNVSFDSDMKKAAEVIRDAVMASPYTVPGKQGPSGEGVDYGQVYFLGYGESSLTVKTTVYYTPEHATESVRNDVNLRVKEALDENGIEIPYPYRTVIIKEQKEHTV